MFSLTSYVDGSNNDLKTTFCCIVENSSVTDIQYLALIIISLRSIETWKGTCMAQLILK